jgi:2'-hydroxyisoflavone reductase
MVTPDKPSDRIQYIDARDLAAFVLRLVERKTVGTFNATSPPGMFTIGDVVSASITSANAMVKPNPAPSPVWLPTEFLEQQKVQPWSDMPVWVPASGEYAGFADASVTRALREGLSIRPVQPTVNDTLAWHLQRPAEERAKLGAGLSPEREKALLDAWREASGKGH